MKSLKIKLIFTTFLAGLPLVLNLIGLLPMINSAYAAPHCFAKSADNTKWVPFEGECAGGIVNANSNDCYIILSAYYSIVVTKVDCKDIFTNNMSPTPILANCFSLGQRDESVPNGELKMTLKDPEDGSEVPLYTRTGCDLLVKLNVTGIGTEANNPNKCFTVEGPPYDGKAASEISCTVVYLQAMKALAIQAKLDALAPPPVAGTIPGHTAKTCTAQTCGILQDYILPAINFLSAGVVLIVVAMIIIAGIQYSTSSDNAQVAQAAKARIYNAVIALLLYFFMFGILEWLIPGGVFNK